MILNELTSASTKCFVDSMSKALKPIRMSKTTVVKKIPTQRLIKMSI